MDKKIKSIGIEPLIYLKGKSFFDASKQIKRNSFCNPHRYNAGVTIA
jgi:hypothetical protein